MLQPSYPHMTIDYILAGVADMGTPVISSFFFLVEQDI